MQNFPDTSKLPRLYAAADLRQGETFALPPEQAHYLGTVLRRKSGDGVRLFNGRDGEFLAVLAMPDRRNVNVQVERLLRPQPAAGGQTHLLFAPLKKSAMDFLIEKAVELGVTHLHPILTQNTETRRLKADRIEQQIIEAAEQAERLEVPVLAELRDLEQTLNAWAPDLPVHACIERIQARALPAHFPKNAAFLIGPEGGFTGAERRMITELPFVMPAGLGEAILRAETAALVCLGARMLADMYKSPSL